MEPVISRDGTRIAFETQGSGFPVILVDGAMCFRNAGPMRPLAAQLSSTFTVVLYDRRGRGESGNALPWAPEREVEDIAALLDAVGGSAALYAVSSGGALALEAAADLGRGRIPALVLFEPPYTASAGGEDALAYTAELKRLLDEGRPGDAAELFLRRVGVPEGAIAGMRSSPGWAATEAIAPTLAYDDALMGDGTVPFEVATRVAQPTLVVDGGLVPFMTTSAKSLAYALNAGSHRSLGGQGHDAGPDLIAPVITEFLATVVPAGVG